MIAITVDDEPLMLYALSKAVKASPDITSVTEFGSCNETLEWVRNNSVDVAFLDIAMRGMGGFTLAKKIMEIHPDCKIVFCTGHEKYAVAAIKLRVSGYLMKPISENITNDQTAQYIGNEVNSAKGTFSFNLAVQPKSQNQTDHIGEDSSHKSIFKSKEVGFSYTAVGKQIDIISKSYPFIGTIAFEICKTVNKSFDQRQGVETEKQCQHRNCNQHKGLFSVLYAFRTFHHSFPPSVSASGCSS